MECVDLDALRAKYKEAVDEFTEVAKKLQAAKSTPPTKYVRLSNRAAHAKVKAEAAHRALRNHIIEHACC